MGKFKASTIEAIEWDVQGAPKLNPDTRKTDGKWPNGDPLAQGTLPEPDPEQAQAYINVYTEVQRDVQDYTLETIPADLYMQVRGKIEQALIDLGFPAGLVTCLPPRYFRALSDHVYGDLVGETGPVG